MNKYTFIFTYTGKRTGVIIKSLVVASIEFPEEDIERAIVTHKALTGETIVFSGTVIYGHVHTQELYK